jgi:molecular chaperone Hsp33
MSTFSFETLPIHGRIVSLTESWIKIRDRHRHVPGAERLLGEMVAVVAMLAQGIELDGSVMLQIRGRGQVTSAMAECTDRTVLRGMLREAGTTTEHSLPDLIRDGQLAITLKPRRGEMYQGIVDLQADSIAGAVEAYFATSEQLPTRIWVTVGHASVAGLLIQRLPETGRRGSAESDPDAWHRMQILADTVGDEELLNLSPEHLLGRLFATEAVRLQPATALSFGCSCSRQRTANALRIMGRDEIETILTQMGRVTVTCKFCGATYDYDPIDAHLLFEPLANEYPNRQ